MRHIIHKIFTIFFPAFFFLFYQVIIAHSADNDDLNDFLQQIQSKSDQISSFSSDFIQEKHMSLFVNPVIFNGSLTIIKPDKLRWEFTSPLPSILILNGDKGIRCSDQKAPEQFQLSTDPVMGTVAEQLWLWLGGNYNHLNDLYRLEKQNDTTLLIHPKDAATADFIESVAIVFDTTTLQPSRVDIHESEGDITKIHFIQSVVNSTLSEQLFETCGNAR